MADIEMIIKIPDHLYKLLKDFPSDSNETTIENVLIKAVENGTPIPDNATNGDVVKTLFLNTLDNFCERTTWEWNRWWNAPYQKGGK